MALLASVLVLGACAGEEPAGPPPGAVTVAAFGFTESHILGELYAQAMEAKGIPVRRAFDLASREVVEPALEQGAVDFVPEYSGTALEFLNRAAGQATSNAEATYGLLRAAFSTRGVITLDPAPAQNQNAVAVQEATAQHFGLAKVSDLRPYAQDMVFGGPPECPERRFCLAGLVAVYGLAFKEVRALDAGGPLTIGALEGDEVDVGLMFTTSPAIATSRLTLLADDRGLQPAENVVPVVRAQVLERHGDALRDAVNAVSALLTTEELVGLNRRVDIDGQTPRDAARAWLSLRGMGKA
jgi:osmoprotectant transport system substrate-binding protein